MKKILHLSLILISSYFLSQNNFTLLTPKPSGYQANKVAFSNDNLGFIINSNKELLFTNDKGITWNIKQTLNFLPTDIKFKGNVGLIVGDNTILRSEDYGMTWATINVYGNSLNSINFIDNNTVFVSGQTQILKSTDKGATFPINKTIYGVSSRMMVFTDVNTAHAACFDGRIIKTVDGGDNWITTSADSSSSNNYYSLVFPSQNVGFANKGFGSMLKTTDGGQTWTELPYSVYHTETYGMQFFDENNGFAVGKNGAVYKTTNGGASWQWISPTSIYGYNTDINLNGLYFFDSQSAFCVGNNGRIIKTQNGGNSWTNYSPTYDIVNELHFVNANKAFSKTNMGEFFRTQDGGNSWQKMQYPPHQSFSNGFTFLSENIGYSIGANQGLVYKTTDGGTTWTPSTLIPYESLYSISFLNENVGFVSGGYNDSGIFKTVDGAATWQKISDSRFSYLKFFNSNLGYGVKTSQFDKLFKTLDGGVTWNLVFDQGASSIAYDFLNENQIFVKGNNGDFYRTNDGGATWTQTQAPYYSFDKIKFLNQNVGFIADGRMVYKTIDTGVSWTLILDANYYNFDIKTLELGGDYLYISGNGGKVYRYSLAYLAASEVKVNNNFGRIYPNPVADHINVNSDKKISEIRLIDISGKVLKIAKNTNQLMIADYQPGMYFVEVIYTDNTKQVTKVIKK